ncbi:GntR family transcriptional regulator [Streptomyces sp. NPDC093589]|uniref:GntR family transcriptional regulator n=1 Tax=Streptomyces sp. NPDC093589 TaxID=3366043 RepID=UPI0037FA0962
MPSQSAAPYLRAADAIREHIASGGWLPGQRLPSRRLVARDLLGLPEGGENIVRRAQGLLIEEGLLEARAGSGTYVRAPEARRASITGPVAAWARITPGGTWTADADSAPRTPAPNNIADRLGIDVGTECVRTDYTVHDPGGQALMAVTSWEPHTVTAGTPVMLPTGGPLAGQPVTARMARIGLTVTHITETITPIALNHDQARRVHGRVGAPALLLARTHHLADRAAETADILVPGAHSQLIYRHNL